jgi:transposase
MQNYERQCIGIDCSKDDFAVSLSVINGQRDVSHLLFREFKNNLPGFKGLERWVKKNADSAIPLTFVMEATGVYHERLACFLYENKRQLSVVLPKRAKDFSRTLKVKTVNDKIAAKYLAIMGLEKKLDLWEKPQEVFMDLRQLTREKERLQRHLTKIKNEYHALTSGQWKNKRIIARLGMQAKLLESQIKEVIKDIKDLLKKNPVLKQKVDRILTIPGIGLLTAVTVIAETRGFSQIRNKRQLISYAGYDIQYHESGTSVHSKARISKKGNRHIRKAMHMPALSSIRSTDHNKDLFMRIVSKTGIKMKGVVAVHRKLLVLIYILWKNDTEYLANYREKVRAA